MLRVSLMLEVRWLIQFLKSFIVFSTTSQYFSKKIPPGWSQWYGLHGNSHYYNYTLNENGELRTYDNDYLTDVLVGCYCAFGCYRKIRSTRHSRTQNNKTVDFLSGVQKPFFAMIAPPAPHAPYTAAERHLHTFENVKALRTPNFNVPSGELGKEKIPNR